MSDAAPKPDLTPRDVRRRIKRAYESIKTFIEQRENDRLRVLWQNWEVRLRQLFDQSKQRPKVSISLVGGTGAGKSTLLNAMIGARVLPVSNMRACTAAITQVGYGEGSFQARIEFVTRASWQHEVDLLLADWQDTQRTDVGERRSDAVVDISCAVRDKLWAVYKPSDDADISSFDPAQLQEPSIIRAALDRGFDEIEEGNLESFRKKISQYLDSKHRFWPIVKSVAISGPFASLQDGAEIIDLPGINDPNEAREEVTRQHLKTCRFVWIVFNIKRALTKDAMSLMQSEDFLRQILMDGREDALTFVGTAADDVDHETGVEEFGLAEEAPLIDVIRARNTEVRKVISLQLDDLALRLAALAGEQRERAAQLAAKLKASRVYTVSAREFLRLSGLAKTQASGFTESEDTEVPLLVGHMRQICQAYGVETHTRALNRQLDLLVEEIRREIKSQQTLLKNQADLSQQAIQEVRAAVDSAQTFLERDLQDAHERLAEDLGHSQSLLAERVKRATDRAKLDLDQTFARWSTTHWATLRAVCRRDGYHVGANGVNDFSSDLGKPILDNIAFAWSEFFGDKLRQILDRRTEHLNRVAGEYHRRLIDSLGKGRLPSEMVASLDSLFKTTEKVLREILSQTVVEMQGRIESSQRTIYETIPRQIRANMKEAYERAAAEKGSGMKSRMIDILCDHARKVAQVMFDEARTSLLNGVRGLADWVLRRFQEMGTTVNENASLAGQNLVQGGDRYSEIKTKDALLVWNEFQHLMTSVSVENGSSMSVKRGINER